MKLNEMKKLLDTYFNKEGELDAREQVKVMLMLEEAIEKCEQLTSIIQNSLNIAKDM